jgi:hypothetical protein
MGNNSSSANTSRWQVLETTSVMFSRVCSLRRVLCLIGNPLSENIAFINCLGNRAGLLARSIRAPYPFTHFAYKCICDGLFVLFLTKVTDGNVISISLENQDTFISIVLKLVFCFGEPICPNSLVLKQPWCQVLPREQNWYVIRVLKFWCPRCLSKHCDRSRFSTTITFRSCWDTCSFRL